MLSASNASQPMQRTTRLFEVIQILRAAQNPMTADQLAEKLEVSTRTIYRDIASLQAMRTPIEGESGIGYILRKSYDLPPLNFDREEVEALHVGLSMLARTGDGALQSAARRICGKIDALRDTAPWINVVPYGAPQDDPALGCVSKSLLRDAIREERKFAHHLSRRRRTGNDPHHSPACDDLPSRMCGSRCLVRNARRFPAFPIRSHVGLRPFGAVLYRRGRCSQKIMGRGRGKRVTRPDYPAFFGNRGLIFCSCEVIKLPNDGAMMHFIT